MKKIILIVCAFLIINTASQAGTCEGGQEFYGAENGHTYCRAKTGMTWWAAFAWCERQERHLASLQEACLDWQGASGDISCPNMKVDKDVNGNNIIWTNSAWLANPVNGVPYYGRLISINGKIEGNNRNMSYYTAICY